MRDERVIRLDWALAAIVAGWILILIAICGLASCEAEAATNTGHDWLRHFPYRDMVDVPFYYQRRPHGTRDIEDHCFPFGYYGRAERPWSGRAARRDFARDPAGCE